MRGDPFKDGSQPWFDRLMTDNDLRPMGMKEFPLQQLDRNAEIAFDIGEIGKSVLGASMHQNTIHIDHQDFHCRARFLV